MTHHHETRNVIEQWGQIDTTLRSLLAPLQNKQRYQQALAIFEELMGVVEAGADASTLELFGLIGENIQQCEQEHHAIFRSTSENVLQFVIKQP